MRSELVAAGAEILSDNTDSPAIPREGSALTPRELEVLRLMALGWETSRISVELSISQHTVRNHVRNLRGKLNAPTKLDAVVTGIRMGLLNID